MSGSRARTDLLFAGNRRLLRDPLDLASGLERGEQIDGLLERREGLCLYLLARRVAALGHVVEIGSYKGRSTWYLASGLADSDSRFRVVAVDPHLSGSQAEFERNIAAAGIAARVDARAAYSVDVAQAFDEPVGLLWIDGDHSYEGVRADFRAWFPRLAPGGWIAFHDTVGQWYGPTKLVRELLAQRADLRNVGVIGMITFAQKVTPSRWNRVVALASRVAFELVTLRWRLRMGRAGAPDVVGLP